MGQAAGFAAGSWIVRQTPSQAGRPGEATAGRFPLIIVATFPSRKWENSVAIPMSRFSLRPLGLEPPHSVMQGNGWEWRTIRKERFFAR